MKTRFGQYTIDYLQHATDWFTTLSKPPRPQKKRPNRARKYTDDRNRLARLQTPVTGVIFSL